MFFIVFSRQTKFQSHHQLQDALDVDLPRPVVDDDLKFSRAAKVTGALTVRRPVRSVADDDFEIKGN